MFEPTSREAALRCLVEMALAEDLGRGDLTAEATVPEPALARAQIVQRAPGVVFGLEAVEAVFAQLDRAIEVRREAEEGVWQGPPAGGLDEARAYTNEQATPMPLQVATVSGPARTILAGERTALNFLGHLSGVATFTARFVEAVEGTGATILDTRKTTPGMRLLEKAAVVAGGGTNHREGLYDAFLIKENHLALAGGVAAAVAAARERAGRTEPDPSSCPGGAVVIEVECETLAQLREAIEAGADRALLDNMDREELRRAVALRDAEAGAPSPGESTALPSGFLLEASGGITLDNVREVAATGVDLISVGALTHSAPALDFSMLVEMRD